MTKTERPPDKTTLDYVLPRKVTVQAELTSKQ